MIPLTMSSVGIVDVWFYWRNNGTARRIKSPRLIAHGYLQIALVHGSHLEQRIFAGTKWLGRYQVQASRFIAQVIVLVIINAMISNDWKIGIMEESKKSQYKYCLIVKIEKF